MLNKEVVILAILLSIFLFIETTANAQAQENPEAPSEEIPDGQNEPPPRAQQGDFGYLEVRATATYQGQEGADPVPVEADVYLNGIKVGKTPYSDSLPAAAYEVTVKLESALYQSGRFAIAAGETHSIDAALILPMIEDDKKALQEVRLAEEKERQRRTLVAFETKVAVWESQAEVARLKRKPYVISSVSSLIVGVAFGVAGGVRFKRGVDAFYDANEYHDLWLNATNPTLIEEYRQKGIEAQRERDLQNNLGIAFVTISGAAVATAIVLLQVMPKVPDKPTLFPKKGAKQKAGIRVAPVWASDSGGLSIAGRF